nr:hypothetical protein [Mycoplasmopsis bovis]
MPFVNLDDSNGEAIIAVKITAKLENGYTESIIGTVKLTELKKNSSIYIIQHHNKSTNVLFYIW